MADYYTQYSKVVPGTNEQIEWLLKKFEEHKEDNEFSELGSYETDIKGLWIYDEGMDGSDIGQVADLLHQYLVHFDLNHELSISWANTCSKPRLSSFTGGAVAITKKGTAYCSNPADVAMKKLKALRLIMNDSLSLSHAFKV